MDAYLPALLRPNAREAIRVSAEFIRGCDDIPVWWQRVIQPALYAVGERWAATGAVPPAPGTCNLIIELTICTAWLGLAA